MTPPTYPHEAVMINVGVGGGKRGRCPRLGAHLDLGRRSERGGGSRRCGVASLPITPPFRICEGAEDFCGDWGGTSLPLPLPPPLASLRQERGREMFLSQSPSLQFTHRLIFHPSLQATPSPPFTSSFSPPLISYPLSSPSPSPTSSFSTPQPHPWWMEDDRASWCCVSQLAEVNSCRGIVSQTWAEKRKEGESVCAF